MYLIITADDFGANNFIDEGIRIAAREELITCVSAFINFRKRNAYQGSIRAINEFQTNFLNIPVGLHLTLHAGKPLTNPNNIPDLVNGLKFKDLEDFSPSEFENFSDQVVTELSNQIDLFIRHCGTPNHISCHFGIVFIFEELLKPLLESKKIDKIPIRNPALAFQIPHKDDINADALKEMKKTFKKKSGMRMEGLERGLHFLGNLRDIPKVIRATCSKKRIKLLKDHGIQFPDYTIDYLYKRFEEEPKPKDLQFVFDHLVDFAPKIFEECRMVDDDPVYEFICHLGNGNIPSRGLHGISKEYYGQRIYELSLLRKSKSMLHSSAIALGPFEVPDWVVSG